MRARRILLAVVVVIIFLTVAFVCCRRDSGDKGEPRSTVISGTISENEDGVVVYNPTDFEEDGALPG